MARDPQRWPAEQLPEFTRLWAEREFGPAEASTIAGIVSQYTAFNGRRKPELLDPSTYSLENYQEADSVVASWQSIVDKAEQIDNRPPPEVRDAFFELVLYPVKASAQVNELYVAAARNRLYATQGRASANSWAARVRDLFRADADLSAAYNHHLAGGKWDHMMDQTRIGYTSWRDPPANVMPAVNEIPLPDEPGLGAAVEGSAAAWPGTPRDPLLPAFDALTRPRRFIDVFNRGQRPLEFATAASAPWIVVSPARGTVHQEQRVWVDIDWSRAPKGSASGFVIITGAGGTVTVKLESLNPGTVTRESLEGFVEANGYVSIEAEHYSKKNDANGVAWQKIPGYGRTLSSMSLFPVTAPSAMPPAAPSLEYRMYLFDSGNARVNAIVAPTLNFVPGRGLRFALSFDDQPPQVVDVLAQNSQADWERSVKDNARVITTTYALTRPGYHVLKLWMVDPGVSVQKLIVDLGGVRPSYLGPPESFHASTASR